MLYNSIDGWIQSNTRLYIEHRLALITAQELELSVRLQLQCLIYDTGSPPEDPYLHTFSCYLAVTQLYAHAGQLLTAAHLYSRGKLSVPYCCFRCKLALQDEHHIFVDCPRFSDFRRQSLEEVFQNTDSHCKELVKKSVISQEIATRIR